MHFWLCLLKSSLHIWIFNLSTFRAAFTSALLEFVAVDIKMRPNDTVLLCDTWGHFEGVAEPKCTLLHVYASFFRVIICMRLFVKYSHYCNCEELCFGQPVMCTNATTLPKMYQSTTSIKESPTLTSRLSFFSYATANFKMKTAYKREHTATTFENFPIYIRNFSSTFLSVLISWFLGM